MPIVTKLELVKKEKLKEDIFKFSIKSKEIAEEVKPGHFLEIRVTTETEPFLRRPISIYNIEGNTLEFIFQVRGKGTEILAERKEGEEIDILRTTRKWKFQFQR